MKSAARIQPLVGRLSSTAFHVCDPDEFEADAHVDAIRNALDLMVGHR
jgi:hypothetical protein